VLIFLSLKIKNLIFAACNNLAVFIIALYKYAAVKINLQVTIYQREQFSHENNTKWRISRGITLFHAKSLTIFVSATLPYVPLSLYRSIVIHAKKTEP